MITVQGSGNSIGASTGTALNLSAVTVGNGGANGVQFNSVSSSGATNGITLANVGQGASSTGIDVLGGSISGVTSRGVDIDATSADVTIAASISTNGTDASPGSGRSVEVTNSGRNVAGGSQIVFSGAINENGQGINLDNNDQNTQGAVVTFSGGLDIDTTTAIGFNATNGGTVTVTGSNNSIVSTTGTALNVANTTIGASDLTFQSISSNGAANGIVLNTTGSSGGLTVTGTGSANSGGTIQNSTGDGIKLTSARDISLTEMRVLGSTDNNIDATTVTNLSFNSLLSDTSGNTNFLGSGITNLTIAGSTFDHSGNAAGEHGVFITGLFGTSSVTNTDFHRSAEVQFKVSNTTATVAQGSVAGDILTMSGVTFANLVGAFFGDNIQINADQLANFHFILNNSSGANSIDGGITGILINASSGGDADVDISNTTITNGTGVGINFNPVGNTAGVVSKIWFDVHDNILTNRGSTSINATAIGTGAEIQGFINSNTITASAVGNGITIATEGQLVDANHPVATISATNNTITGVVNGSGISAQATVGSEINLTLNNNHVNINNSLNLEGIRVISGSSSAADGTLNIVRLNMLNNDVTVGAASGQEDYLLQARMSNTFQLQDFVGNGNSTDTVDETNWVIVTKDNNKFDGVTNPVVQISHTSGGVFTASVGNIPTPVLPTPLLAAAGGVEAAPSDTTSPSDGTAQSDTTPPADTTPPQETAGGSGASDPPPTTPRPRIPSSSTTACSARPSSTTSSTPRSRAGARPA